MSGILKTKDYCNFEIQSASGNTVISFQGALKAGKAFHGDWVSWDSNSERCSLIKREKQYPIVGILELASKTKYGMTSRGSPIYLFVPFRKEFPSFVVGCSERDTSVNRLAIIDFDAWDTTNLPRGILRKIIGVCGDLEAEKTALLLTHNPYPSAKQTLLEFEPVNLIDRVKCPPTTFNIDPIGCYDIDDVLSLVVTDTIIEVWITIADVAEYIQPNSEIDTLASLQAFTAYDNGFAVKPMLPKSASEDRCSLLPNNERYGVSLILQFKPDDLKTVCSLSWKLSTVFNVKQYDYDTFAEKAAKDGIQVNVIASVASGILGYETNDPHKWIEAFMIKYNIEAAKLLKSVNRGVLRKHSAPDLEDLETYKSFSKNNVDLSFLAQRSATYCKPDDELTLHYGLQAEVYCHATSPLRRYADLLNQRVLKDILLKTESYISPDILWLNMRQKELKRYERDLFFLSQLSFYKKGKVTGIVFKKLETKLKIWILEWNRIITWKPAGGVAEIKVAESVNLSYFANPSGRSWKEKIIFHLDGSSFTEN
jgi:exoribonuclease R